MNRNTRAYGAAALACLAILAALLWPSGKANADPLAGIACPAGVPIVLYPEGTWACTPVPEPSTVTETVYVTPSPSQSASPVPSASPSATVSPTPAPSTPAPSSTPTASTGCPAYPAMPDASCTGYAHTGVTLRSCALRITAPGTYDGCRFKGTVVIASSGVTITRSLIQGHVEGSSGANLRGAVLEDVTIIGQGNDGAAAIGNNNYTCRRCDISGGLRGFAIGSNVVIEDSYAHDFWIQSAAQRASNSVHQTAASTHGGAHIRITHSTLYCRSDAYACSSGVSLYSEDSPGIDDVLIEKSYLATDAGYALMFASLVAGKPYGITNTRVVDCIFGPSEYGPVANFPRTQAGNLWTGNRMWTGATV